jgi:hypothetical protein
VTVSAADVLKCNVPYHLHGMARILTAAGTQVAAGSGFDLVGTGAADSTHFDGAVPGANFVNDFKFQVTTTDGAIFASLPSGCVGIGTITATCDIQFPFQAHS